MGQQPLTSPRAALEWVASVAPLDRGELVQLHGEMLRRNAVRLCGHTETAKDLVQETLLRALQRSDQLQQGTNTGAWLVTILTNLFYDQLKHEKVELRAVPELAVLTEDPSESVVMTAPDSALYAAIDALAPDLREVIELCCLKQMRYRQVATLLNVPIGTVGTRLKRARSQLLDLLTTPSLRVVKP